MCCRGRQENLCIQRCAVGVLQRPGSARAFGVTADDSWANGTSSGSPAGYRAGSRNPGGIAVVQHPYGRRPAVTVVPFLGTWKLRAFV